MPGYKSNFYFTDIISVVGAIGLIVVGLFNIRHLHHLKIFIPYALLSAFQTITSTLIFAFNYSPLIDSPYIEYSINVFMLFESLIFSIFFYSEFENPLYKKWVLSGSILLILAFMFSWFIDGTFGKNLSIFTTIESMLYIAYCLMFYHKVFKTPPQERLEKNPAFWATTGIFILFALLFPLFLFRSHVANLFPQVYYGIYIANYIGYIILFSCLIKSFVCQMNKAK